MKQTTLNFKKIVTRTPDISTDSELSSEINTSFGNSISLIEPSLSEYELIRLRNIERNGAFLASLGVEIPTPYIIDNSSTARKRKLNSSEVKETAKLTTDVVPTRRSSRLFKASDESIQENQATDLSSEQTDHLLSKISYSESAAAQHFQRLHTNSFTPSSIDGGTQDISNSSFMIVDEHKAGTIACIYAMNFHPKSPRGSTLLMAAGKGGELALLDIQQHRSPPSGQGVQGLDTGTGNDSIMAFRAHSRWISSVKFVNPSAIKNFTNAVEDIPG